MSTRANIVIKETYSYDGKDQTSKLFFYRHSDGYPEGTMPTLNIFLKWLKESKIRTDVQQGSGWLILLGAIEYNTIPEYKTVKEKGYGGSEYEYTDLSTIAAPKDWKVGAYEPTTGIHGDIEYLYVIDLGLKEVKCYQDWTEDGEGKGTPVDLKLTA